MTKHTFQNDQPVIVEAEISRSGHPIFTIYWTSLFSGEVFDRTIDTSYQDWDGTDADDMYYLGEEGSEDY